MKRRKEQEEDTEIARKCDIKIRFVETRHTCVYLKNYNYNFSSSIYLKKQHGFDAQGKVFLMCNILRTICLMWLVYLYQLKSFCTFKRCEKLHFISYCANVSPSKSARDMHMGWWKDWPNCKELYPELNVI